MAVGIKYEFPVEVIERVAELAAKLVLERGQEHDHWMAVAETAEYLRCPASRIYALTSTGKIPHHHDGARLLFRKSELDAWVERGGARRT